MTNITKSPAVRSCTGLTIYKPMTGVRVSLSKVLVREDVCEEDTVRPIDTWVGHRRRIPTHEAVETLKQVAKLEVTQRHLRLFHYLRHNRRVPLVVHCLAVNLNSLDLSLNRKVEISNLTDRRVDKPFLVAIIEHKSIKTHLYEAFFSEATRILLLPVDEKVEPVLECVFRATLHVLGNFRPFLGTLKL